jgi:PAS domain S-box-containing protein
VRAIIESTTTLSREEQGFLYHLVDSISIPVFYKDTREVYLGCNNAFAVFCGIDKEKIIGKTVYELFPQDMADTYHFRDAALFTHPGTQQYESVFQSQDGIVHRVVFYKATYTNDDREVCGLVGLVLDITEQREAEERLCRSEEKFRTLFETMTQGVVYQDAEGRIVDANRAAEKILGLGLDSLLGKRLTDPCWQTGGIRRSPAGTSKTWAAKNREPIGIRDAVSGEERWVMASTMPVAENSPGQPYSCFTTLEDVTVEKQAERALKQSEAEKGLILNSVDETMIYLDLDCRIIWMNDAASRQVGMTGEEILGRCCYDIIWKRAEMCPWCRIPRVIAGGKPVSDTVTLANGCTLQMTTYPVFNKNGYLVGYLEKGLDITEITKTQGALEEFNKKLNLLSSITRHDILNQVMALRFYADEIEAGIPALSPTAALVEKIKEATTHIERQIAFARDYEALGVHGGEWQRVADLLERASGVIPRRIRYSASVGDLEVFADPLLERVFYNIFENALSHGKHVTAITVSFVAGESSGTLIIEDNGIGIPEKEKEGIFLRGVGKKTGLGLFLSKEILGITGITIAETGREGARFEIRVPKGAFRLHAA